MVKRPVKDGKVSDRLLKDSKSQYKFDRLLKDGEVSEEWRGLRRMEK